MKDIPHTISGPLKTKAEFEAWKTEQALEYCSKNGLLHSTCIVKIPDVDGCRIGYMSIHHVPGFGISYFRVDGIIFKHE